MKEELNRNLSQRALLDIEASQIETNQGLQNREIFFSLIFPFKEFGDWNFSFSKMKSKENEDDYFYTFNLHTKNENWRSMVTSCCEKEN